MSIRVLHVITRLSLGGASENTVSSIVALQREGYECALALGLHECDAVAVADARRRGCSLVDVPSLGREITPLRDLAALAALARLMRKARPTVVHTHTSKAGFIGRLAARLARVPIVIHQPHGHVFYGYWNGRRTDLYVALERLAARWSDRIITLTDRGIEEHLARGIGRREQYISVPSGVPVEDLRARRPSREEARASLGIAPSSFVVAAVGRFVPIKGFDVLISALPKVVAKVPDLRLILVGDGPERDALRIRALALGVERCLVMPGAAADVSRYVAAADVLAAPSRNEGMGRALVEAMALGLPVVATTVGGIPDVVIDGECGRLVPSEDTAALGAALIELARDPRLRAKLGDGASSRAEKFSTAVAHRKMLAIYETLIRERSVGR